MEEKDLLKKLKNLRRKWRSAATKEAKLSDRLRDRNAITSAEKCMGIWIGTTGCANDLDKLVKELEECAEG